MLLTFVFIIGCITGFLDALVGLGGFISIPFLMLAGLPPHTALACDRFGIIAATGSAFFRHYKSGNIVWKWIPMMLILAGIGGLMGSSIAVSFEPDAMKNIISLIMLLMLPLLFIKKNLGVVDNAPVLSKKTVYIGFVLYALISIYAGFLGLFSSPMYLLLLTGFFGMTILQVQGTEQLPWFVLSIVSFIVFALNGYVDWLACIVMFMGMALGGYLGADAAIRIGNKKLKILIAVLCTIVCLFLLLDGLLQVGK